MAELTALLVAPAGTAVLVSPAGPELLYAPATIVVGPTAWGLLIMNSTLPSGTAWEHLNAQESNFGVVINDGVAVEIDFAPVVLEVLMQDVEIQVIDDPIVVEIEDSPVEACLVAGPIELEHP